MKKCLAYICLCLFAVNIMQAQEVLTGLHANMAIKQSFDKFNDLHQKTISKFIYYEAINLPFIDDFSNYTVYPDTILWIDKQAFVNYSFAVNPPSVGVATLDAVDKQGEIYAHAQKESFPADSLTSRPIRLDSIFYPFAKALSAADSIYFSFYYQPGGGIGKPWAKLGDAPESSDSLVLEFGYYTGDTILAYYTYKDFILFDDYDIGDTLYSPCDPNLFIIATQEYEIGDTLAFPCDSVMMLESVWNNVWSTGGTTLQTFADSMHLDTSKLLFKQVLIPVIDSVYFNKGFQFRFRNYASLEYTDNNPTWASNVDFWHIDYIRFDRTRTITDTLIDDVAFSNNPGSVLAYYQAIPWTQFKNNQGGQLKQNIKVKLSNLSSVVKNTSYIYFISDIAGTHIEDYDGGSYNISPLATSGFQNYAPHSLPPLSVNFPSDTKDSAEFMITHIFREAGSGDMNPKNDTVVFYHHFHNYYAYDDGIPESGYTVVNVYSHRTSMALGFSLSKADTLRAVGMYINHVLNNANNFNFTLTVWADSSGYPGRILHSETIEQEYNNDLYGFQHYYLSKPVPVIGKFFIGYQINTNNYLNVGFDQNNDNSQHVFYKTGNYWESSFLSGTPMLRPFLGKEWKPLSIEKSINPAFSVHLFPNPVNDMLSLSLAENINKQDVSIEIYSISGQKLYKGVYCQNINVAGYQNGFYILKVYHKKTGQTTISKFVIHH
ncbi:MAG TPA: T9SS type A sorting domain-containing protein [Bacteroidales bacterium]|nr:T9SS type A sorting domain-containing protein [Bacteroidales bacterium]